MPESLTHLLVSATLISLIAIPSYILVRYIKRKTESLNGGSLTRLKEISILLPAAIFLLALHSEGAGFLRSNVVHRAGGIFQGAKCEWLLGSLKYAGILATFFLPFWWVGRRHATVQYLSRVWLAYAVWLTILSLLLVL